jgi:glycine/D-amino acid oxidase-like deaminating enzyme
VMTEKGRIACDSVVLAGGVWSRLFCGNNGIRLPQLKVLSSVMRTSPVARGPGTCSYLDAVAYRRRRDGGYTIARGSGFVAPLVPDSMRYLSKFMPTLRKERASLRVRVNAQSWRELRDPRSWRLDGPSPFEATRVLDPAPNRALNRAAFASMQQLYPAFKEVQVVQEWAGYIDVTPDVIPYIGAAGGNPGLIVATGFSGHGFGIGPAAGRLAAELAIGAAPFVDPSAFRLSRFSDGTPIVLGPEI